MKKHLAVLAFLSIAAIPAFGEKLTGYISDTQCAVSGSKAAKATDWINPKLFPSCAKKCMKDGSPIVFVTEDNKILKLDADSTKKASTLLGHRVSVNGTVDKGTLTIEKIASIRMKAHTNPGNHQEESMH